MKAKNASELHHNIPADYYEKSIKNNPLQWFWHTRRFKNISRLIEPVDGEVLDVGSADGIFTQIIAERSSCRKIIGIDVLENSVQYAAQK